MQQLENRPELDDLAKNPLLLNMITNLHRSYPTEELPKRRSELYREVVNLQLGNRPLAKQINLLLPPDEAQKVLQQLALYMVEKNKKALEYNLLFEQLKTSINSFDESVNIKQFIQQIIDVSELLVKRDESYEFAHLSFQAYLAAKEIIDISEEGLLKNNWNKAWWKETILLYSAQVNPNDLLRKLIDIGTKEAMNLALRCIDETPRKIDAEVTEDLTKFEELEKQAIDLLFQNLEKDLQNKQWQAADLETSRLMIQIGDKHEKGYLNEDDINNFPCKELRMINDLWVKNSDGKFGFTVQKQIWLECGGKIGKYDREIYIKFAEKVRWYFRGSGWVSNSIKYIQNEHTPFGHLPTYIPRTSEYVDISIFSRAEDCRL